MSRRPTVICHMATSVDGRTLPDRWRPADAEVDGVYEQLHAELAGDAWLIGRVSGQEFTDAEPYPPYDGPPLPREPWMAHAHPTAIVLDPRGQLAWGRADLGGDPLLVVLTEAVPDRVLAGLRADGVSYRFAGADTLDLHDLLRQLYDLGLRRLLLEGGGHTNSTFLRAGLVDELSLLVMPAVDGTPGAPALFDAGDGPAPIRRMRLLAVRPVGDGGAWLRYTITA